MRGVGWKSRIGVERMVGSSGAFRSKVFFDNQLPEAPHFGTGYADYLDNFNFDWVPLKSAKSERVPVRWDPGSFANRLTMGV